MYNPLAVVNTPLGYSSQSNRLNFRKVSRSPVILRSLYREEGKKKFTKQLTSNEYLMCQNSWIRKIYLFHRRTCGNNMLQDQCVL